MKDIIELANSACVQSSELGCAPNIHQDDFIFQFLINNPCFENHDLAVRYYFQDGRKSADQLCNLMRENGLEPNASRLLEFASGYGCVTRHFPLLAPAMQVVSCDIHEQAGAFICEKLKGQFVGSCTNPDEFRCNGDFDAVFALSFFSHMPRSTWARWLAALYRCVRPGGLLIFTTQGLGSSHFFGNPTVPDDGFWFKSESEQKDLNVSDYGQTIVTREFVESTCRNTLGAAPTVVRESYWWGHQDLYLVKA